MGELSFGRENDRKKRVETLRAADRAIRLWKEGGWFKEDYYRHFQLFSKEAKALKNRIETHDYAPQDKIDERWLSTPHQPLPVEKGV